MTSNRASGPRRWPSGIVAGLAIVTASRAASAQMDEPPTLPPPPLAPLAVASPPPPIAPRNLFHADVIIDGAIIAGSAGFVVVSSFVIGTGELKGPPIDPNFSTQNLISIDRGAVTQTVDKRAAMFSNVGLGMAIGYAVLDPILSGVREQNASTTAVDAAIYGETAAVSGALTNIAKLAVRRPRPIAYQLAIQHKNDPNYVLPTDDELSFYSGHASTVAGISATATYLAFVRSPRSWRPWVTMLSGVALTSWVSYERVRAGAHFPTDVITGSLAGAGVGIMVPYLHREDATKPHPTWIGWSQPGLGQSGALTFNGIL